MNQKFIITGGPGTGKTSVINELRNRGFYCIGENSRQTIADHISKFKSSKKKLVHLENQIANMRLKAYLTSPSNNTCFFDRSSIDCIAYLALNNLSPTEEIIQNINKQSFNRHVFFTPIWKDIYTNDNIRKENIDKAQEIENSIIKTYESKGYKLIKIPKTSIKKRADFIISNI